MGSTDTGTDWTRNNSCSGDSCGRGHRLADAVPGRAAIVVSRGSALAGLRSAGSRITRAKFSLTALGVTRAGGIGGTRNSCGERQLGKAPNLVGRSGYDRVRMRLRHYRLEGCGFADGGNRGQGQWFCSGQCPGWRAPEAASMSIAIPPAWLRRRCRCRTRCPRTTGRSCASSWSTPNRSDR